MIPDYWASAFANHLWQSTVFAAAVGLLAFALRENHARTRYRLWLIASVKFLVPFSFLIAIGGQLRWPTVTPVPPHAVSVVMEQIGQPFPQASSAVAVTPSAAASDHWYWPALLLTLWAAGFLFVVVRWWLRWRSIRAAVRAASPLALRTVVPVMSSPALLEPGVFGIVRPILLLPDGIADRLGPEHLEAVVAHELCHVRRWDNLAAAIHMLVEAVFWFHPLVWWVGARLVEERERACDEEVLRLGSAPEIYAESIVKTCQFYLESPLACMAGITGSDLKKRIVRIMTQRLASKLSLGRKLLLACAGIVAIAGPIIFGLVSASQSRAQSQTEAGGTTPSFEVASIKPSKSDSPGVFFRMEPGGRFTTHNVPLKLLVEEAFNIKDSQLSGAPAWIGTERYDIEAKPDDAEAKKMYELSPEERRQRLMLMMQSLLKDRFKLTVTHTTKELPVYELVLAKGGPKFHEATFTASEPRLSKPPDLPPPGQPHTLGKPPGPGMAMMRPGQLMINGARLDVLTNALSRMLGRIVVDKTGLTGKYDFALNWTPDEAGGRMFGGPGPDGKPPAEGPPPVEASGPTIFTALQEQLGLKLESRKGPVDVLLVDHIERPSEN